MTVGVLFLLIRGIRLSVSLGLTHGRATTSKLYRPVSIRISTRITLKSLLPMTSCST